MGRAVQCRARGRKKLDRQLRATVERQVAEHFAQHAGEFEAVAGEAGGQSDLRILWMPVDDEVGVGGHRVHADRVVDALRQCLAAGTRPRNRRRAVDRPDRLAARPPAGRSRPARQCARPP